VNAPRPRRRGPQVARSTDRERALAAGFDAHLTKPVDTDELIRVLQWMRAGKNSA
jgi:CheY-like chemotaxis protein